MLATKIPVFIGSLGYTKQTGVSLNSEMERFTGRVDASNKYKKVEFGMNASFSWTKNVHLPEVNFMEVPFMHQK